MSGRFNFRVLAVGDAINQNSSYGVSGLNLYPRFKALGIDIAVLGRGVAGTQQDIHGIKHYRTSDDGYSQGRVGELAKRWNADLVFSFCDLWALHPHLYPHLRHVPYYPLDRVGFLRDHGNGWDELQVLKTAWDTIAFSQFAQKQAEAAGIPSKYIPLGVDTRLYKPHPFEPFIETDGPQAGKEYPGKLVTDARVKHSLGIPQDAYVIGLVAANADPYPTRKNFHAIFEGFAFFLHSLPGGMQNATIDKGLHAGKRPFLYVHTDMRNHALHNRPCVDLIELAREKGILHRLIFTQQGEIYEGFALAKMPYLYSVFDVLLHLGNEGYGLPGLEAAACGIPVIGGMWTATAETSLSGINLTKEVTRTYPVPNAPGCERYEVASTAIADALHTLQTATVEQDAQLRYEAVMKARAMDWDTLTEQYWIPLFTEWSNRLASEKAITIPASGSLRQPVRPGVGKNGKDFQQEIVRAMETEARNIIFCPSWGEKCGIAEYAITQSYNFGMAGYPNYIATRSDEVDAIVRASGHVKRVILHHEYSFFDGNNPRLDRGENTPGVLRTLKNLQDDMRAEGRDFTVSIVVHTVHPKQHGVNSALKASGLDLYATSIGGGQHLECGVLPLGVWQIPGYNPVSVRGLVKSVLDDPAGIPAIENFTIGNFGFFSPQRDVRAQIELCRRTDSRFLGSFASHAPEQVVQAVKADLEAAGVAQLGVWGDYAPRVKLMQRLEGADVMYMRRDTKPPDPADWWFYSSATVQMALLLGIPVIVNSDRGYADLVDVLTVADTIEEAVAAIERLRNPAEYSRAVDKIIRYRDERDVTKIYAKAGVIL